MISAFRLTILYRHGPPVLISTIENIPIEEQIDSLIGILNNYKRKINAKDKPETLTKNRYEI